jgi:DHA1 family bicyclomycin/chloramphenicol resistance-like MFS transporter
VGSFIDTTALPLFIGFFFCGITGLILIQYLNFSNRKKTA